MVPCPLCLTAAFSLEPFLVPTGDEEIRLELDCDWIDMRTAMHWLPRGGVKEASN